MAHIAKIQKWAKARAVIIPKAIWQDLGIKVGDLVTITSQHGAVVIEPLELPKSPRVTVLNREEEAEA